MKNYVTLYKYYDQFNKQIVGATTYCEFANNMTSTETELASRSLFLQMDLTNEYLNRLLKIRLVWLTERLIILETGKTVEIASAAMYHEDINGDTIPVLIVDVLDTDAEILLKHGYADMGELSTKSTPPSIRCNYTNMLYNTHTNSRCDFAFYHNFSVYDVKGDIFDFITKTDIREFETVVISILETIISTCMDYGNIYIRDDCAERVDFNSPDGNCLVAITNNIRKLTNEHNLRLRHVYVIISDFIMYDVRTVFGCIEYLHGIVTRLMNIFEREKAFYDILLSDDESNKADLIDEYYTRFGEPFTVWESNKDYMFDEEHVDSVVYNGKIYFCLESHRSTDEFDYNKWKNVNAETYLENIKKKH